jgi:putative transposase
MPTRLHRYDIPGHTHFLTFSCYYRLAFFWHDAIKQIAIDGLRRIQLKFRICLVGYVIMPEHMHLLIYPHPKDEHSPVPISKLLHAFKKYVGYEGKKHLRRIGGDDGKLWSAALSRWLGANKPLWQTRGYDFNIDRHETLIEKLHYCHKNPVTRKLVADPADWPWSSYRFYEFGDRSVLSMDWDKSWPIRW